ncbi:hypothetical protein [Saccharothrix sp. Mg75]|uniref:hypothetical protein n=1 Tax=Saccharothrix sp. Mg75 TaxID=3445357 RepID=UPI003EECD2EB
MTSAEPHLAPERRRWSWRYPVEPRWLLCGGVGGDDDLALALCAGVEGVFVDLPARSRERFTLVGCTPDGVLADLLDRLPGEAHGTGRALLGDLFLAAPHCRRGAVNSWAT